jgi:hypothetical protein
MMNLVPLCTLEWADEHPADWQTVGEPHERCLASIYQLYHIRTHLWHHGSIPKECQGYWAAAQEALPGWPGFRRLDLDERGRKNLAGCAEELDDMRSEAARYGNRLRLPVTGRTNSIGGTPTRPRE